MANVRIPHLALPFGWEKNRGAVKAAEVEQGTLDEIAMCVEAILRTPYEWRDDRPNFGRPPTLFDSQFNNETIRSIVQRQEPRAEIGVDSDWDPIAVALRRINVEVSAKES